MTDKYSGLTFDDYSYNCDNESGHKYWAHLCEEHAVHSSPTLQQGSVEGCLCGVKDCYNTAEYYYDFAPKKIRGE